MARREEALDLTVRDAATDFLVGGGEMGALMRSMDWGSTPLGPTGTWPASLCTSVSTCLNCAFPILIWWGPQLVMLYNDEYRFILGSQKHPGAMGSPGAEVWSEIWDVIGPMLRQVTEEREPARARDLLLLMDRYGYLEETYFSFSYSPVIDEKGAVGGVFCPVIETTQKVIAERRLHTLRDLAALNHARERVEEVCSDVAGVLAQASRDIPFVLIYLAENDGVARLCATGGITPGDCAAPQLIDLHNETRDSWPLAVAASSRTAYLVTDVADRFATLPMGGWTDPPHKALIMPIVLPGHTDAIAFLIAAVSPRRDLDPDYSTYFRLIADQMTSALADVRAFEEERGRAAALAEIDRAKTVFFSNISHEFRTPLTLLLGPLDQALSVSPEQLPAQRGELEVAYRNGKRLLHLVNTLLDFARLEAGRIQAVYEPIDLAASTAELASVFRSAAERAGLRLVIECSQPVANAYVDRDMWEKIVLNLLSNAIKYTLEGEIRVSVQARGDHVELVVADTGIGIASADLPHVFERFYRVQGARGRTHEGSGIGLSLVSELIRLHGGQIKVESELNLGSAFTVRLPLGSAHLPKEHISGERTPMPTGVRAQAYIEEVLRWMPGTATDTAAALGSVSAISDEDARDFLPSVAATAGTAATILIVDDNSDMREYLRRLLAQRFNVIAASDGAEAFSIIERTHVDLVLSDVMMPRLDGFALLKAIRTESRTRDLPIILLSARAGEEARIAGLDAGADDYLVKPFSSRELLARVSAQITVSHFRRQAHEALRAAEAANWQATEERNRHLQAQHEQLRELFEKAPGFMAVLRGEDHIFEFANPAFYTLAGHRDIIGKPLLQALPELAAQPFPELLHQVFATGEAHIGKGSKILLQRAPGPILEGRYVDFVYQPLRDNDGNITGVFLEGYDVTERIQAENSLHDANRRKDEFLATLAHELRNPLAALAAAAQLLARAPEKPGVAAMAREALHRQVDHMARLLDDLLEVSRITHGMVQLRKEHLKLEDAITAAVESAQPLIDSKRHHLVLQLPDEPVHVNADRVRLTQIIANLLTNAAKYTDPGGRIDMRVRSGVQDVEISVRDNGIGIAPGMLERVFEMFSQAQPALQRSEGGLGIGLSLVRGLVELHGGTVAARSEGLRMGSEFVVRLPLVALEHPPTVTSTQLTPATRSGGLRILIADDNLDSANSWAMLLEMSGHDVRTARNGQEALAIAAEFQPQLTLLDIGMPEMNGYEVARRLRLTGWGERSILVAVTGWGHEHDKQQAKNAGFDHHLTKPVGLAAIEPLLAQAAEAAARTTNH